MLGRPKEARPIVEALIAESKTRYVSGDYIAEALVSLGDKDGAIRWLERANEDRSQFMLLIRLDPRWRALRDDPRFIALANKIAPRTPAP
jgi:hypothetical protein